MKQPPRHLFLIFSRLDDVQWLYTVPDLKTILTDSCLTFTGDKKTLVTRVCEHAAIQTALLDDEAIEALSDPQIIYALQQLKLFVPWDVAARLEALARAGCSPTSGDRGSWPSKGKLWRR